MREKDLGLLHVDSDGSDRSLYRRLRAGHRELVPVIGSGLTVGAGAPSFRELGERLRSLAPEIPENADGFDLVDHVAGRAGESAIARAVSNLYSDVELIATPALKAIAQVRSGLVLTTNYDLAIENAARAIGRPSRTMLVGDLRDALAAPGRHLRVVHIHGVAGQPETIVVTRSSYERILGDSINQLLLRSVGVQYTLVFLGHSLDDRERHLRRDLSWLRDAGLTGELHHLLVTSCAQPSESGAYDRLSRLAEDAGIDVFAFREPPGMHKATQRAANAIAGPSPLRTESVADVLGAHWQGAYVPLPMGKTEELATPGGRGAHMARVFLSGQRTAEDLDTEDRLLIVAPGGWGKSVELTQIAQRSDGYVLSARLTEFDVASTWQDPIQRFVACMSNAVAPRENVPRLTDEGLESGSYVFLLDALDEVTEQFRAGVVRLINEVAMRCPQHRFVITSRPLPETSDLAGFSSWTPTGDLGWVKELAARRAVDQMELDSVLTEMRALDELVTIPIFAVAILDQIDAGEAIPETALELVCALADQRTKADPRIEANRTELQVWLDRAALAMELAGLPAVPLDDLARSSLARGLASIAPDAAFITFLATRAMLVETAGSVRFPANVVQEARAARALVQAGADGLQLLRDAVLIELEARDADGQPIRTVRQSWTNTLDLLISAAPREFRDEIARYDPCLVARSTPSGAEEAERHEALWTLWRSYTERKVWFDTSHLSGTTSSDATAVIRLADLGIPQGFADHVRAALHSSERTQRGNAFQLAPVVLDDEELLRAITDGLSDEDPVVRRQAAMAAWQTHRRSTHPSLHGIAEILTQRAADDPDDMAPQTLIDVALDLAANDRVFDIAVQAPPRLRERALDGLVRRIGREQFLQRLRASDQEADVLSQWLSNQSARELASWTPPEIAILLDAVLSNTSDDVLHHAAASTLQAHPETTIVCRLYLHMDDDVAELVGRMAIRLQPDRLAALNDALQQTDLENQQALSRPRPGQSLVPETVEVVKTVLGRFATMRRPSEPSHGERGRPSPELPTAAQAPARSTSTDPVARDAPTVEEILQSWSRSSRTLTGDARAVLLRAAEEHLRPTPEQVAHLALLTTVEREPTLDQWLGELWSPSCAHILAGILRDAQDLAPELARTLPPPWPPGMGQAALTEACSPRASAYQRLELATKTAMAEPGLVRSLAGEPGREWLDPVLVRLGDPEAEQRLLASLLNEPRRTTTPENVYGDWIPWIRHASSLTLLREVVIAGLADNHGMGELKSIHTALSRVAGCEAPKIWQELSRLPIPGAAFLFYDHTEAIRALVPAAPAFSDPDTQDRVTCVVRR